MQRNTFFLKIGKTTKHIHFETFSFELFVESRILGDGGTEGENQPRKILYVLLLCQCGTIYFLVDGRKLKTTNLMCVDFAAQMTEMCWSKKEISGRWRDLGRKPDTKHRIRPITLPVMRSIWDNFWHHREHFEAILSTMGFFSGLF
jgi:hypothetical protein